MQPERRLPENAALRKRLNRAYVFQNGFVLLVAFLFLVTSASFWLDPHELGRSLGPQPPFDVFWNAFYSVGSVLIIFGLLTRRIGVEAAGHFLLVPGLFLNFLLCVLVLGFHATTLLTFVFAWGAALRGIGLIMGWRDR